MEIVNASKARANLFSLLEDVNKDHLPRMITSKKGDAVLLSKLYFCRNSPRNSDSGSRHQNLKLVRSGGQAENSV